MLETLVRLIPRIEQCTSYIDIFMTSELNFEQPTHEERGTPSNYFASAERVTIPLEAQFFSCPQTLLLVYSTHRLIRSTLRK